MDADQARFRGLQFAVQLWEGRDSDGDINGEVLATGQLFASVLHGTPAVLVLTASRWTFEQGRPALPVPTRFLGENMSVQMSDTQEVTYAVAADDSKGFPVADTLTWSEDSGGVVVAATPSADGSSCLFVAAAPGTATITVTDGTLSASDLITVTPGGVASLVLTPGAVTDQPPPPPPPAP